MEELHKIAESYYNVADEELKAKARKLFDDMACGEKRVKVKKFIEIMNKNKNYKMANKYFFNELKRDGRDTLDFMEVMTAYYIIMSKRPFCGSCGEFIQGAFFTCFDCFHNPEAATFNLCVDCYHGGEYEDHEPRHKNFLDNFALLAHSRPEIQERTFGQHAAIKQEPISTSTAIVPYDEKRRSKKKIHLDLINTAVGIASFIVNSPCSIM